MEEVLVEQVVGGEPRLDRDELAARVLLVAEEEEARRAIWPMLVDALVEVVAAPEDPLALAVGARAGIREPDVRGDVELARLDRLVLRGAPERRARILDAADELLLLAERGAIPLLDPDPDLAGHEVAAAGHPAEAGSGCGPDVLSHPVGLGGIEIGGAVLEAHQVARRAGAAVGAARGSPSGASAARRRPVPSRVRLRIAWNAT